MARLSLLATVGLTVAILGFPTKANALGPLDIEIGARVGTAAGTFGPLGFGIGGRGGASGEPATPHVEPLRITAAKTRTDLPERSSAASAARASCSVQRGRLKGDEGDFVSIGHRSPRRHACHEPTDAFQTPFAEGYVGSPAAKSIFFLSTFFPGFSAASSSPR